MVDEWATDGEVMLNDGYKFAHDGWRRFMVLRDINQLM